MIQELFGARAPGSLVGTGERKISITDGSTLLQTPVPSSSSPVPPCLTNNSINTSSATTNTTTKNSPETQQNLRCPRCDSTNTKFCYYNNYNLTQPRHFCKTCRRYWTKGGALRNVPIGGGCRKNKGSGTGVSSVAAGGKPGVVAKARTVLSISDFDNKQGNLGNGFGQDSFHQHSKSVILNTPPQSSHILALFRATQNQNPNPSPISNRFVLKSNEGLLMNGSNLGLDAYKRSSAPLGMCSNGSLWKSNQQSQQGHQQLPQHRQSSNGFVMGDAAQNSGIQELLQKLKSASSPSPNYYDHHHHSAAVLSNRSCVLTSSSSHNLVANLDTAPVAVNHDFGYFTTPAWSELPTPNGIYPDS